VRRTRRTRHRRPAPGVTHTSPPPPGRPQELHPGPTGRDVCLVIVALAARELCAHVLDSGAWEVWPVLWHSAAARRAG
jgi:hypothetical protein